MELKITMLNGEWKSLVVQPGATVGSLKALISQQFGVATHRQRLSYNNGQRLSLDDDSTPLSSYGLESGSQVCMVVTEPVPIQVFLKNEKGMTSPYEIAPGETVQELKRKVHSKEGVPVDQQRLIHEGKQMDDGRKLDDYNVRSGSTIHLTLRLRGG